MIDNTSSSKPSDAIASGEPAHPGKTPAQRRILDEIGCGNFSPMMGKKTMAKLLDEGTIQYIGHKTLGRDALGVISVPKFQMSISVHLQWCQYWAAQPEEDEAGSPVSLGD